MTQIWKVTLGGHPKVTPKVTQKWLFGQFWVTFGSLSGHFWVTFGVALGWPPKVTFESLFCVFTCFGVWGVLWGQEGHKSRSERKRFGHSFPSWIFFWGKTFPSKGNLGELFPRGKLSGLLNRLNAILSLLHPLDRYRTDSAIVSAIGRPLSRIQTQVGVLNCLVLNRFGGSTAR